MRTARSIALAAVAVGTVQGCAGGAAPCDAENGLRRYDIKVENGHHRLYPREMPDLDMLVGDTVETYLGDYFGLIPGCVELLRDWGDDLFSARAADPSAVAVSIAADLTTLTIAAVNVADSVRVVVWNTLSTLGTYEDPEWDTSHEFFVRVRPPPAGR